MRTLPDAVREVGHDAQVLGPLLAGQPRRLQVRGQITQLQRLEARRHADHGTRVLTELRVGCGDDDDLGDPGQRLRELDLSRRQVLAAG